VIAVIGLLIIAIISHVYRAKIIAMIKLLFNLWSILIIFKTNLFYIYI